MTSYWVSELIFSDGVSELKFDDIGSDVNIW